MKKNLVILGLLFMTINVSNISGFANNYNEALKVFGLENQNTITLDVVKKKRNQLLMKASDDVAKAKINDAFDVLKAQIENEAKFFGSGPSKPAGVSDDQRAKWKQELLPLASKLLERANNNASSLIDKADRLKQEISGEDSSGWFADKDTYERLKKDLNDLGKEITEQEKQRASSQKPAQVPVKTYKNIQEALDAVVMGYPFNKASITEQEALAWANVIASLKAYIKGINTTQGILEKISSKNIDLFEKALQQISLATSLLISAKQGKLADKAKQLKTISDNLNKLQIELKPVTTGLFKDFVITQQVKDILGMLAAKLEASAKQSITQ